MTDEIQAMRTNNGQRVWEWGGSWSSNKGAMHFEIDCTPLISRQASSAAARRPSKRSRQPTKESPRCS